MTTVPRPSPSRMAHSVYAFCSFGTGPEASQGAVIRSHTASPRLPASTWEVLRCLGHADFYCCNAAGLGALLHSW